MKKSMNPETERLLGSVTPKPAPAGLREKVLGAAARSRAADSATTPLLRICVAGCAVILLVVFIGGALASKHESRRLMAMLGTPISGPEVPEPAEEIVDPLLDQRRADRLIVLADGKGERRTHRDLRELEKRFILEEFNGN